MHFCKLLLLLTVGSLPAANLIYNPGFEDWMNFGVHLPVLWMTSELTHPGSADTTTVYVHSGQYALQLVGSDTVAFASTMISLGGVKNFHYSGWAESPQFLPGTFSLTWLDSSLAVTGSPVLMPVVIAQTYGQFYTDCTAPDSAAYGLVAIVVLPGDTLYVDDVALEPGNGVLEPVVPKRLSFTIFPNPASVRKGVSFSISPTGDYALAIYDACGRLVCRYHASAAQTIHWDCRSETGKSLAAGVYFVKFLSGSCKINEKIIILP